MSERAMHSCIEREKRRVLRGSSSYILQQWIPVIALAKKNGLPYKVYEMDTSCFKDFKELTCQIGKNFTLNTKNDKVNWPNIRILELRKESPHSIFYKYNFDETSFFEIAVTSRKSSRLDNAPLVLKDAYTEPPKISKKKKDGLLSLCREGVIPEKYHQFFENLSAM